MHISTDKTIILEGNIHYNNIETETGRLRETERENESESVCERERET